MKPNYKTFRSTQQGATLIVALIFLLIMSIIAFTSMSTSVLEEKMSVNLQNYVNVFQVADSGMEQAINDLGLLTQINPCDKTKRQVNTSPSLGTNVKAKTVVDIYYVKPPGVGGAKGNTDNATGSSAESSSSGSSCGGAGDSKGGGAGISWGGSSGGGSSGVATYQYKADSNSELVANNNIKASVKQGFFYCPLCQN